MSHLSDIGFAVQSEEDLYSLVERAYGKSVPLETTEGTYFQFSDSSGAELWLQVKNNKIIGMNPHFRGKSKRKVCITHIIERAESVLDGAFYSWADPMENDNPESGEYPFIFDVPNHKKYVGIEIPQTVEIQLSAFAQDFDYYESEDAFYDGQDIEPKWASQAFVPIGLLDLGEDDEKEPLDALGVFSGVIKQTEKRRNGLTNQEFYWLLVDTLGGEIDVLADLSFFENISPQVGGIIHGKFWLSGSLISKPKIRL